MFSNYGTFTQYKETKPLRVTLKRNVGTCNFFKQRIYIYN